MIMLVGLFDFLDKMRDIHREIVKWRQYMV